jgi:hypothetical protein
MGSRKIKVRNIVNILRQNYGFTTTWVRKHGRTGILVRMIVYTNGKRVMKRM